MFWSRIMQVELRARLSNKYLTFILRLNRMMKGRAWDCICAAILLKRALVEEYALKTVAKGQSLSWDCLLIRVSFSLEER